MNVAQIEHSRMWKVLWKYVSECLIGLPKSSFGEHIIGKIVKRQVCQKGGWVADGWVCHIWPSSCVNGVVCCTNEQTKRLRACCFQKASCIQSPAVDVVHENRKGIATRWWRNPATEIHGSKFCQEGRRCTARSKMDTQNAGQPIMRERVGRHWIRIGSFDAQRSFDFKTEAEVGIARLTETLWIHV